MAEFLSVERVDVLRGDLVVIELSDGRTVQITLAQVLGFKPNLYLKTGRIQTDLTRRLSCVHLPWRGVGSMLIPVSKPQGQKRAYSSGGTPVPIQETRLEPQF